MDTELTTRDKILQDYIRAALLSPVVLIAAVLALLAYALFPSPVAIILGIVPLFGAGLQTISLIRASIRTLTLSDDDDVEYDYAED